MPSPPTRWYPVPTWAGSLAIFGIALAAFWPSVAGGILWDDPAHIAVPELQSWAGLWKMVTHFGVTQEYYPGLFAAFWFEHQLWGDYLPAYHVLNIALHAGSACLLALVLRRLWGGTPVPAAGQTVPAAVREKVSIPAAAGWFAAAAFAVHPVTAESVAWMTEQKNTLSVFFYVLAALLYLRFDERRRGVDYAFATGAFFLALSAKTAAFTLPPALLVVAWWQRGRVEWRRDVVPLLLWFGLAVVAGLVTVHVETNYVGAKGQAYALSLVERLMLAPRIVWFYVLKDFVPSGLLFFYPRWNVPAEAAGWWPYLVGLVGVTIGLFALRRRARGPLAGWLLFLGAIFPVMGFFNVFAFLFSYVADHFQYVPCLILVATATGMVAFAAARRGRNALRVVAVIGAVVIAANALETRRLSARYRDNETLFRHVLAENPDSWMAHQILASALAKSGHDADAITHYRDVIRLKPDYADAYLGLGVLLARRPETKAESIRLFEHAIQLRERYVEAHYALGLALSDDPARRQEAIGHLEVSTGLEPYFVPGQIALGTLLAQDRSRLPEAVEHFRTALKYQPTNAPAQRGYGDALARSGATDAAIAAYETALRYDPNDAIAHFHLADVLARTRGREGGAPAHYETALRLNPNLAEAHLHFAAVLAQQPNRADEVVAHVEAAVRAAPNNADAHNTLGILYIQRGDAVHAREQWETALRLDPNHRDARANLQRLEEMMK